MPSLLFLSMLPLVAPGKRHLPALRPGTEGHSGVQPQLLLHEQQPALRERQLRHCDIQLSCDLLMTIQQRAITSPCCKQVAVQDWSEFRDWPTPLGAWPCSMKGSHGTHWSQQICLSSGQPWQLVRPRGVWQL